MTTAELLDTPPVVDAVAALESVESIALRMPPAETEPAPPLGEWVALIAAHQEHAMCKLHHAVAARVHRVVTRIVPDAHLAEEVVGECFWQVWREAGRFDATRGSVTTWLTTIARSRALDAMRRRKALASHEETLDEEHEDAWAPDRESPLARLEARQRDRRLHDALARIDPIQRQLLSLSFVTGLSHEEMAEHCGLALGTVKSHIRRGLTQMRMHCVRAGLQP